MTQAYIYDAIRTPIGRYGGGLSSVRTDDLGAIPMKALMDRNPHVDWSAVDDVIYGCEHCMVISTESPCAPPHSRTTTAFRHNHHSDLPSLG